ncbi:hypothetical protein EDC19_1135 [Natranaerovirga hydrolytica]|uniref:Uncharacterized protein n=1 Tax=Natranaerovirga hydrolytica TaxID=680378 RepID=A0A4R1N1B3_9FIRM|nr:NusG domain II-containing protein [Natranaerovirga hydrolytica]TCK98702.1 hypothetical protein EDC19_1135 [Natranaerovirga hydrolytica]
MKKGDIIVIIIVIVLSVGFLIFRFEDNIENKKAVIRVNGQKVKEIDLTNGEEGFYQFAFDDEIGEVEVKDQAIRMVEMDLAICPRKICSDMGFISGAFETIICLPNGIVVNIESNENINIDEIVF